MINDQVTIVTLVALPEEHLVFQETFPVLHDHSTPTQLRLEHESGREDVRLISVLSEQMGSQSALLSAVKSITDFEPDLVVMVGIAGALTGDAQIGDVCVSNQVLDVLHNTKVTDGKAGAELDLAPDNYAVDAELVASFTFLTVHPKHANEVGDWREKAQDYASELSLSEMTRPEGPGLHIGPIACGPVVASEEFKQKLKSIHRKVTAVETESGGVFGSLVSEQIPAVAIRGVCDLADQKKTELEDETKGTARKLAMSNAVELLKLQLSNERFVNVALRQRQRKTDGGDQLFPAQAISPSIVSLLDQEIREKLAERSPEFRAKPDSFYLPIPRARRINVAEQTLENNQATPESLVECLKKDKRILVRLDRTYPSQALGWSLAYSMIRQDIEGRTALPYVVTGQEINPPRTGLEALLHESFMQCANAPEFARVLIIEEPLFHARNRMRFLNEQLAELDVYVLVISKTQDHVAAIDDFTKSNGLVTYELAPVSLSETAYFLEKAFDMPASEADAVAIRLDDTFRKFQLDAHPTYFAGIGEDTIAALINANKRAELIQLAVDALLSLIVAVDKANPPLSRTTRDRFLRQLVLETAKRRGPLDDEQLLHLATEFLEQGLFPTSGPEFLQPFFDVGLLYRMGGAVYVTHPYLQSYLLAQALRDEEGFACEYFSPDRATFDYYAFDLYCEIGPSDTVIDAAVSFARSALAKARDSYSDEHVYFESGRKLITFSNPEQLRLVTKKLNETADRMEADATDGASVREEKQKLVDARRYVRKEVKQREVINDRGSTAPIDVQREFEVLDELSRSLSLVTTAVGAGSESLTGERKVELAKLVLNAGEKFVDVWTRNRLRVDFPQLRNDLLSDENVWQLMEELEAPDEDFEKVRSDLNAFLHSVELNTIAEPFARVLWQIASTAGVKVLSPVLGKTDTANSLQELIRGAWMLDINPESGKDALKSAFVGYNGAPFARLVVANHILSRAYWHHYKTASSPHFLTAARRSLRSLKMSPKEDKLEGLRKPSKKPGR